MNPLRAIYFRVVAKGGNDNHQMSDMTNLPAGRYLTIEAGTTRSAALGHDGSILWGGQAWTGSQLPQGNGYTDIALGPDYGFALKEAADEIILSGPISPDKPMEGHKRGSTSNDAPLIPLGSTIEHSDHDVTRIFGPDGTQLSWVNDKEAQKIPVSDTTELPVTRVFSVPSEAFVNQSSLQTIVVNNRTGLTPELSVISNIRPVNPSQAVTSGIYYQNIGGTVASVVGDDVFIAPLIQTRNTRSVTDLTYKYMRLNYDSGRDINIYCEGSGDMATCEGQVSNADDSLKRSESPAPQPLIFTIVPTDTTGNQPLKLSTETIASKDGSILHYTITATSSQTLPEIKISPAVFRNALENYTFMHGDQDVICYDTDQCRVAGDYIVSGTGNYLASGYVNFTVPAAMSNTGTPRNFNLLPDSDIILFEQPSVNARSLSAASSVPDLQIGGNDIWLWGIASENQNKENPGEISWVNIVIYNKNRFLFLEDLQKKSGGIWHHGSASAGNGNSGKSKATMTWSSVDLGENAHLEKGAFLNNKEAGGRYHCPLFAGGYSESLKNEWTFSNCHHEYWVWGGIDDWKIGKWRKPTHLVYTKAEEQATGGGEIGGYDKGRAEFYNDLVTYSLVNSDYSEVDFNDAETYYNYHNGKTWVLTGK